MNPSPYYTSLGLKIVDLAAGLLYNSDIMPGHSREAKPLLFMKTGLIGAEPQDFYPELASAFGATVISPKEVYKTTFGRTSGRPTADQRRYMNDEAERQTRDTLLEGVNVLYDGYLNTRNRRTTVRALAEPMGGQVVLLCVQAPIAVIRERLVEKARTKHPDDAEAALYEMRGFRSVMKGMVASLEQPLGDEPHLFLNGELPVEALVEQTRQYVTAQLAL